MTGQTLGPGLPGLIGAKLHLSADTAVPSSNTWRPIPLDTTDFDKGGFVSGSKLVIPLAGYYSITAGLTFTLATGGGYRALLIRLNGTGDGYNGTALVDSRIPPQTFADGGISGATSHLLNVGDVLELVSANDATASISARSTTRTFLSAVLLGV